MGGKMKKLMFTILILGLVAGILAGCGGDTSASEDAASSPDAASSVADDTSSAQALETSAEREGYDSAALDTSYEGALPASTQLAVGTMQLEGTENAVTPVQAESLLPLWQAIQGGSLQSDAETNAVLKQIEGTMTAEQLAAIAALQLTFEDMGAWMQEQGLNFGPPQGAAGGQSAFGNMSDEERAAMRATRQAGGAGGFSPGGLADMSEEDRAAMRATAEASGMTFPGGGAGGGRGQLAFLAELVVELLTPLVA
jgi:hypothetical protein